MRREVFFFPSGGVDLHGSVYAGTSRPTFGIVVCNSWGYEANLASPVIHALSLAVARSGGVAFSFHYPGFGDSWGSAEAVTIDGMVRAAANAFGEAARREQGIRWTLVGLMLGSSIAALASARGAPADRLLLLQPALRPSAYFARLERASKRHLGGPAPAPASGFAHGYPLCSPLLQSAPPADTAVASALARFGGEGAVVRYEKPAPIDGLPDRLEQVCVSGTWRYGLRNSSALVRPATDWLCGARESG